MKPRIRIIAGRPVTIQPKVQEARERFGRPFAHEAAGRDFVWNPGPTVLDAWKREREKERR